MRPAYEYFSWQIVKEKPKKKQRLSPTFILEGYIFNELQFVMLEDVTSLISPLGLGERVIRSMETITFDNKAAVCKKRI